MMFLSKYLTNILLGVILTLVLTSAGLYTSLYKSKATVSARDTTISEMNQKYLQSVIDHNEKIAKMELESTQLVQTQTNKLKEIRTEHEKTLSGINADYAERLLNMQKRLQKYATIGESGSVELRDLARHTAELDRTVEEGRQLVAELKSVIELRDKQLIEVGQLLLKERAILTK